MKRGVAIFFMFIATLLVVMHNAAFHNKHNTGNLGEVFLHKSSHCICHSNTSKSSDEHKHSNETESCPLDNIVITFDGGVTSSFNSDIVNTIYLALAIVENLEIDDISSREFTYELYVGEEHPIPVVSTLNGRAPPYC